jgi:hypothetical protein
LLSSSALSNILKALNSISASAQPSSLVSSPPSYLSNSVSSFSPETLSLLSSLPMRC